jgi:hypothetical protein
MVKRGMPYGAWVQVRLRGWLREIAIAAGLLAITIVLQWRVGAYRAELDGYPDESGHYVTGLLIRDYAAAGFRPAPRPFAESYYLHYPRISFGHWPPFFHVVEAFWTLLFSGSRASVLVLIAVLTAATAAVLYFFLETQFGTILAAGGALLFLFVPLVRDYAGMIMTETTVALLCLIAALYYARYLRTESMGAACGFGVAALLAILTKPNGWLLGLVPPLCVLITRRWALLRRASFWLPAAIVLPGAAWYAWNLQTARRGWTPTSNPRDLLLSVFMFQLIQIAKLAGPAVLALALAGFFRRLIRPGRNAEPEWVSLGALWIATLLFHSFIAPVGESRHLLTSVPCEAAFAMAGCDWLAKRFRSGSRVRRIGLGRLDVHSGLAQTALVLVCFALLFAGAPKVLDKPRSGLSELAAFLSSRTEQNHGTFFIHSDVPADEGAFVAEIAMRDKRPDHMVIRDSKWLSIETTAEGLLRQLELEGVQILVLDGPPGRPASRKLQLLEEAVRDHPQRAALLWNGYPAIRAFELREASRPAKQKIQLDLRQNLGKILAN